MKKRSLKVKNLYTSLALLGLITFAGGTFAAPQGGVVTAGSAAISHSPGLTQINQSSNKAIIEWKSFNIGAAEKTQFRQPSANSIALNRIDPNQGVSQIYGQLSANGKIILINQAGIFFGPGSRVDVGGIIASTSNMSNANFLSGNYTFDRPSPYAGSIVNKGRISAADYGLVALVGTSVQNDGTIQARKGSVVLGSGNKFSFTLDLYGDQLINFKVDEEASSAGVDHKKQKLRDGVSNTGTIVADGGNIIIQAKAARGVVDNVINMKGVAQANSVLQRNGEIILLGDNKGVVRVSGKILASGKSFGQKGGKVRITSKYVKLEAPAKIDVSGSAGGGEILIGGNYQGKGPLPNATATVIMPETELNASAIDKGDGGQVIIWSDDATKAYGKILARGVNKGGFVETSGKNFLSVDGIFVDVRGNIPENAGTWLLDPRNVSISSSATSGGSFSDGTFTPTSDNAVIKASDLEANLSSANILVTTGSTGSQNGDISVDSAVNWSSSFNLTLSAYRNITLGADIINSGGASVVLRADNTGTGTGTVSSTGGTVKLSGGSGTVSVYYNPTNFGTPDTIYPTGGVGVTTPIAYMLINQLGSSGDTTTRSLASISNTSGMWDKNFALAKDINASGTSTWNSNTGFIPIGNVTTAFTGQFDGQSYTITSLTQDTTTPVNLGMFGRTTGATINNLGLITPSITGGERAGGFIGTAEGTTLSNSYVSGGTITASSASAWPTVGGLIGFATSSSTISNSYNSATLSATGSGSNNVYVGGIVGVNDSAIIQNSYNLGTISGTATTFGFRVGGIAGYNATVSTIQRSYNKGSVSATNDISGSSFNGVGGVVGENAGTVSQTYNLGNITGNSTVVSNIWAGGLIGELTDGSVTDSYSMGTVTGTASKVDIGGLIGRMRNSPTLSNSFSTGPLISGNNKGGLIGNYTGGTVTNSYWDVSTSGLGSNGSATSAVGSGSTTGITGYNTANMMVQNTFSGFNFSSPWSIIAGDGSAANGSYPYLNTIQTSTPRIISGYMPGGNLAATGLANNVVKLSTGSVIDTVNTGENGFYYFLTSNGTINDNSPFLVYLSGASSKANVVGLGAPNGASSVLLNMAANRISVYGNSTAITNTDLGTAKGSNSSTDILYSVSGANLTLANSTNTTAHLVTSNSTINTYSGGLSSASTAYTADGTITTVNGGTSSISFGGPLIISSSGISTSGSQTYGRAVTLSGSGTTTLTSTGGSGISFNSTLDGTRALAIADSSGAVTFDGKVGDSTSLASLSIGTGNSTTLNANVSTSGSQTYSSTVALGANITLATTSGNLIFNNTLDGGGNSLTLSGDSSYTYNSLFTNLASLNFIGGNSGNNSLAIQAGVDLIWTLTGSNSGNVTGISALTGGLTFSSIQNLIGDSANDSFVLSGGSLSGSLNGNAGTNKLTGNNVSTTWNITSNNAGSLTGVGSFSNIQNLIGGTSSDNFVFSNSAAVSGTISGGDTNSSNTIDLSAYTTATTVNITGGGSGSFNPTFDQVYRIAGNTNTNINFVSPASLNRTTGVAIVNNTEMQFVGVPTTGYSGNITESVVTATEDQAILSAVLQAKISYGATTSSETPLSEDSDDQNDEDSSDTVIQKSPVTLTNQSIQAIKQDQENIDIQQRQNQKFGCI